MDLKEFLDLIIVIAHNISYCMIVSQRYSIAVVCARVGDTLTV